MGEDIEENQEDSTPSWNPLKKFTDLPLEGFKSCNPIGRSRKIR